MSYAVNRGRGQFGSARGSGGFRGRSSFRGGQAGSQFNDRERSGGFRGRGGGRDSDRGSGDGYRGHGWGRDNERGSGDGYRGRGWGRHSDQDFGGGYRGRQSFRQNNSEYDDSVKDEVSEAMDTTDERTEKFSWKTYEGAPSAPASKNAKIFEDSEDDEDDKDDDLSDEEDEETKPNVAKKEPKHVPAKVYFKDAKLKAWRLIIRNLSFNTKKSDLQNICSKIGTFTDIVLPESKKMPGKIAGFAFVQFHTKESAEKAREFFNSNKINGRSVASDWALDKDTYETGAHNEREKLNKTVKVEKEEISTATKNGSKSAVKDNEDSDMDDDDDEISDEEMDDEELSEAEEDAEDSEVDEKPKKKRSDNAVEEKRVVFLRNLSFDTTEEVLKTEMCKFGDVKVAVICKYHDSGHSKGTAFVHFSTADEAAACIEKAELGEISLDDRMINGSLAIPKEKAVEMEKEKQTKVPTDKRNLRLLRFGVIREGTAAAKGMSKEDAAKRVRLTETARKKLENLHMFVSPVRILVHNIPPSFNDEKLKTLCREAAGGQAYVKECRIWKDKNNVNAKGEAKSMGFGFVAFTDHNDALKCLEKLNNCPTSFTKEKRPIVEFSIENLAALQAKERRVTASKGAPVDVKQVNEKVRAQVQASIGTVHAAGMKFLPKFLGKKQRHRDMSKTQKKKKGIAKGKSGKGGKPVAKSQGGVSKPTGGKKNKKVVTKYLALST